jgi:hypothetical protein
MFLSFMKLKEDIKETVQTEYSKKIEVNILKCVFSEILSSSVMGNIFLVSV